MNIGYSNQICTVYIYHSDELLFLLVKNISYWKTFILLKKNMINQRYGIAETFRLL